MPDLTSATLSTLAAGLEAGTYSSRSLTEYYLDRIRRLDGALNAFASVDEVAALDLADAADRRRAAAYGLGPLDGLPIAVKDLCDIKGRVTTAGSRVWSERRADATAPVVQRLIEAGMVVLGKTQMVEFAFGGWGTNPHLGTPLNPWDLSEPRIPGGSSSGSGVAVAAGLVPAALGSDTGGSVRIPAAANGVTGLKTSRGRIDLAGTVPLSSTLDTIGFLARTAEDALLLTRAVGDAPRHGDQASWPGTERARPLAGIRIATMDPRHYPVPVADDVQTATEAAIATFRELGATIEIATVPFDFMRLMQANGVIIASEAYAYHRHHIEDEALPFGPGVRSRVLSGKAISASAYLDALGYHREMQLVWQRWSKEYHALLTPCLADPAIPVSEVTEDFSSPAVFTRAGNFVDATGLALPAGFSGSGLPVGIQLLSAPASEAFIARLGAVFQQVTEWHNCAPDLSALDS
ncbi:MAG: amidase [Bosea sp.]|uniref:amidase n=1 Tax=Bosea sp. (in: a-proteobacteria) TaxID=1871050 RepID=UPI001AD1B659|nr:amidase [Bosea sp. (in: a-proteobacteria)]MBN9469232.1 amidase [Bosea sp. (in: a-proteobacteria)]